MIKTKIAGLAVAAGLALTGTPATAAPLGYDEGTSVHDIGDWPAGPIYVDVTWVNSKWPTAAAIKKVRSQTGLDVRVTRGTRYLPDFTPCQKVKSINCVTASSDRKHGQPRVAVWSEGRTLVSADVTLKRKPKASKAARVNAFARVLKDAVGR